MGVWSKKIDKKLKEHIIKGVHNQKHMSNQKNNKTTEIPLIPGVFANWAGVNQSQLQTIIDFGFIQPSQKDQQKKGVIFSRIILPPQVAEQLGEILVKKNYEKEQNKKNK